MHLSQSHGNASRILIVDDDRDTVESMACLLKFYGHEVEIALEGYQAIEVARQQQPEYILLDLAMPGLNGYQVAARLREVVPGSPILIAVTGYGQTEDRRRALASGFDHHFLKPVELDTLLNLLSGHDCHCPAQGPIPGDPFLC